MYYQSGGPHSPASTPYPPRPSRSAGGAFASARYTTIERQQRRLCLLAGSRTDHTHVVGGIDLLDKQQDLLHTVSTVLLPPGSSSRAPPKPKPKRKTRTHQDLEFGQHRQHAATRTELRKDNFFSCAIP
jgi:hypothetical protein